MLELKFWKFLKDGMAFPILGWKCRTQINTHSASDTVSGQPHPSQYSRQSGHKTIPLASTQHRFMTVVIVTCLLWQGIKTTPSVRLSGGRKNCRGWELNRWANWRRIRGWVSTISGRGWGMMGVWWGVTHSVVQTLEPYRASPQMDSHRRAERGESVDSLENVALHLSQGRGSLLSSSKVNNIYFITTWKSQVRQ